MPHDVHVTFDVAIDGAKFPFGTVMASNFRVIMDYPEMIPVHEPYHAGTTAYAVDILNVPAGEWMVGVSLEQPDGTVIGEQAVGTVTVPGDDVVMDSPINVHVTVGQ